MELPVFMGRAAGRRRGRMRSGSSSSVSTRGFRTCTSIATPLSSSPGWGTFCRSTARSPAGRASAQLEEVLPAAHDGRVDVLFTAQGARLPGAYDPGARTVQVAKNGGAAEDLLDEAAVQTFLHGGRVFAVPPEAVPAPGEPLAAVFRY